MKDHYKTLEINFNATAAEIKKAYQKLALKFHPDKNIGNEDAAAANFKDIGEAYEILSDPQKKSQYDSTRQSSSSHTQANSTSRTSSTERQETKETVAKRFYTYVYNNYMHCCKKEEHGMKPEVLRSLKKFIADGLDINIKYTNHNFQLDPAHGYSLLYMAIVNNDPEFIQFLVAKGANINEVITISNFQAPATKSSPFSLALYNCKDNQFLSLLINKKTSLTKEVLDYATVNKKPLFMTAIIQAAKDRKTLGSLLMPIDGTTLLHRAAQYNNLEGVRLLINAGININAVSVLGNTPLHVAIRERKNEIAQELVDQNASLKIFNNKGETVLKLATEKKDIQNVNIIISAAQRQGILDDVVEYYLGNPIKNSTHAAIAERIMPNPEILVQLAEYQKFTVLSDLMTSPNDLLPVIDNLKQRKATNIQTRSSSSEDLDIDALERFCNSPEGKRKLTEHESTNTRLSPTSFSSQERGKIAKLSHEK